MKNIVQRWRTAKACICAEINRIEKMAKAIVEDIKAECGQTCREVCIVVDDHTFTLTPRGNVNHTFASYGQGWHVAWESHWPCSIEYAERLNLVAEKITGQMLRSAYENSL